KVIGLNLFPASFRDTEDEEYRFDPTDIRDGLQRFTYIHQLMQGGVLQKPEIAEGTFVPRNWKELREWEDKGAMNFINKIKGLFNKDKQDEDIIDSLEKLSDEEIERINREADEEARLLEQGEQMKNEELNKYQEERAELLSSESDEDKVEEDDKEQISMHVTESLDDIPTQDDKKQSENKWMNKENLKSLDEQIEDKKENEIETKQPQIKQQEKT